MGLSRNGGHVLAFVLVVAWPACANAAAPPTGQSRIEAALENITALERPGKDALATIWDGDKYVQCLQDAADVLRCEASGALMQPSLSHVLTPERVARIAKLGWRPDPAFGNYVQTFPPKAPPGQVAAQILQLLAEGYDADAAHLEVRSDWIADEPCPPRNGPSQSLAGMINDAPLMAATAVHACAYLPSPDMGVRPASLATADLVTVYGPRVTGEIQRLRVNLSRDIFVAFQTDAGYVQCAPQTTPEAIYCEAESADSWSVIASVLTPERLAKLHAAGYADPGHAPNYSKTYPLAQFDDAAIAQELLSILHDVYGYGGSPRLAMATEKGDD